MSLRKNSNAAIRSQAEGMNMSLLQGLLALGVLGVVVAAVAHYLL